MRREDKQITDSKEIDDIISDNQICRIALSDGDQPYLLPVNYGYKNKRIFIHSAGEGRKLEIIKNNNRVCFEITDSISIETSEKACGYGTRFRSVIGFGRINLVRDSLKKIEALNAIMYQHTKKGSWDFIQKQVEKVTILEIEIESVSGKKSKL